ncbi:hypothetical protein TREPR_3020 [Treponema primitia ZAS-2]|uniref:Uroporphyrinogen decarboxylase (URO-D) domain-containing protein n=1 Tax=Treponema primitia (strain ATCC BAA-887 / DSM 12427 / ZAS-2) TaxID=545694 RepID=F5YNG3_TREPZ|nr:uroporphyrinogen decarboxylase family protein [Treponema primitia]AEF83655.1 hypothetical protein TREPR_3020 [Treponema primitia ZAS-2]
MTSKQRIKALLENKSIDRSPVAGWFHMPLLDRNVTDFTQALISTRDYYGWDFIKVMTNGHFMTEAYGGEIEFSQNPLNWYGTVIRYPVRDPHDAAKLPVLNAKTNPLFKREVAIVKNLVKHYKKEVPIIATIFNALTSFQELNASLNPLFTQVMIRHHKEELHKALRSIQQTNKNYLDALIAEGIDGIFLVNQYAAKHIITSKEYDEFVTPYDNELLEYIKGKTWFNMAHIHGEKNLWVDKYVDTLYHALNWENTPKGISPGAVSSITKVAKQFPGKVLITGLDQNHDFVSETNDREEVKRVLKKRYLRAKKELGSNRFIFGPGCTLPLSVPNYLFTLIREVAEEEGN